MRENFELQPARDTLHAPRGLLPRQRGTSARFTWTSGLPGTVLGFRRRQ